MNKSNNRRGDNVSRATKMLTKDWQELVKALPDDLETSAKEYQALRRRRGIKSGADLLRLILLYAIVLSLRLTAVWSVGLQLCDISRQAIEKRVLACAEQHSLAALFSHCVTARRGTRPRICFERDQKACAA